MPPRMEVPRPIESGYESMQVFKRSQSQTFLGKLLLYMGNQIKCYACYLCYSFNYSRFITRIRQQMLAFLRVPGKATTTSKHCNIPIQHTQ